MRSHETTHCPKCGAQGVHVYELALPEIMPLSHCMGELRLAAHNCSGDGDHMVLQAAVDLR